MKRSHGYVMLAAFGFSFILIFSTLLKNSGMSSLQQVLLRLSISLIILFFVLLCTRQLRFISRRDVPFFAAMGLVFSLFTLSGLSSIVFGAPIAVAVALVYTQPIFTALISHFTRKEKITLSKLGIILIGVLGVFLVGGLEITKFQIGLGFVFPILAGFFYALYLWLKRQVKVEEYTSYQTLFNSFLFAVPSITIVGIILRTFSADPLFTGVVIPNTYQLTLLFLFALFSTILPYGALNYVRVEEISPTTEGLALLGDPLLHTLWAMVFFKQYVSEIQYMGALLILFSAALNIKLKTAVSDNK